jgi:hypothetical protein
VCLGSETVLHFRSLKILPITLYVLRTALADEKGPKYKAPSFFILLTMLRRG